MKNYLKRILLLTSVLLFIFDAGVLAEQRLQVPLAYAPDAGKTLTRSPGKVRVDLETKEVTGRLADGVEYNFWTFGGTVLGPIIRIVEGDEVEFHLNNHSSWQTPHAPSCSDCLKAKL